MVKIFNLLTIQPFNKFSEVTMGQKVHPTSLRLGIVKNWSSQWYAKKRDFPPLVGEDNSIRTYIKKAFATANISKIEIARASSRVRVSIHTARPGVIIGRKGADIDRLRDELQAKIGKEVFIEIREIKMPQAEAQLIAENIAFQLLKRIAFRRAMKRSIQQAKDAGVEGIKISCAGRLGGAEMSRREGYKFGKVPLQTFKADIDYGFTQAHTPYGLIGVKVWVYKGDKLQAQQKERLAQRQR